MVSHVQESVPNDRIQRLPRQVLGNGLIHRSSKCRGWNLPAEQEEVVPAQAAPEGLHEPVKSLFHGISDTHASEIDGFAIRTSRGKETKLRMLHCSRATVFVLCVTTLPSHESCQPAWWGFRVDTWKSGTQVHSANVSLTCLYPLMPNEIG